MSDHWYGIMRKTNLACQRVQFPIGAIPYDKRGHDSLQSIVTGPTISWARGGAAPTLISSVSRACIVPSSPWTSSCESHKLEDYHVIRGVFRVTFVISILCFVRRIYVPYVRKGDPWSLFAWQIPIFLCYADGSSMDLVCLLRSLLPSRFWLTPQCVSPIEVLILANEG